MVYVFWDAGDQRISNIIRMSQAASFNAFTDFLDAVNLVPELEICMPIAPEEWDCIYKCYKGKSTHEIVAGCVGCHDGFFQRSTVYLGPHVSLDDMMFFT